MPHLSVSVSTDEATTAPSPVPVVLDAPAVTVAQNPYAAAAANAERIATAFREQQAQQAGNAVQGAPRQPAVPRPTGSLASDY